LWGAQLFQEEECQGKGNCDKEMMMISMEFYYIG